MTASTFRELQIWQKGMDLVVRVYQMTRKFPKEEIYGLTNQMRRATVSIPSNIAEGFGRSGNPEFLRFLYIAKGSLLELETQTDISRRLEYITETEFLATYEKEREIEAMISSFIKKTEAQVVAETAKITKH